MYGCVIRVGIYVHLVRDVLRKVSFSRFMLPDSLNQRNNSEIITTEDTQKISQFKFLKEINKY